MFAMEDGRIIVYGGYYKEKIKKDYDKGTILIDMFMLTPESKYFFIIITIEKTYSYMCLYKPNNIKMYGTVNIIINRACKFMHSYIFFCYMENMLSEIQICFIILLIKI
jgi:hypothetical protein